MAAMAQVEIFTDGNSNDGAIWMDIHIDMCVYLYIYYIHIYVIIYISITYLYI